MFSVAENAQQVPAHVHLQTRLRVTNTRGKQGGTCGALILHWRDDVWVGAPVPFGDIAQSILNVELHF